MREVPERKQGIAERAGWGWTRLVSVFAPQLAARQAVARKLTSFSAGGYRRGRGDRRQWYAGGGSADADNLLTLQDRREKSRDRYMNDPVGRAGIRAFVRDIGTGLRPEPKIAWEATGFLTEETAQQAADQAKAIFHRWASSKTADICRKINFYQSQRVVQGGTKLNGDMICLVRRQAARRRSLPVAFQLIEADRCSTPTGLSSNGNIRDGIEIDEDGAPVAYHIRKAHPGDWGVTTSNSASREWVRIPALNEFGQPNVLHRMEMERPEQSRGVPAMSTILDYLHDNDRMMEAELMAQLLAASIGLIIKSGSPQSYGRGAANGETLANQRLEEIYPAMIEYIGHDEEWDTFNPSRPGDTFQPFMAGVHRLISLGFDLPLPAIFNAWEEINYSGARTIKNEEHKVLDVERYDQEIDYCDPWYEIVMTEAWLRRLWLPEVDPKTFFALQDVLLDADWTGPSRGFIDPLKEAMATRMRMRPDLPISTLARECALQGLDWREVIDQQGREMKRRVEKGLPPLPAEDLNLDALVQAAVKE